MHTSYFCTVLEITERSSIMASPRPGQLYGRVHSRQRLWTERGTKLSTNQRRTEYKRLYSRWAQAESSIAQGWIRQVGQNCADLMKLSVIGLVRRAGKFHYRVESDMSQARLHYLAVYGHSRWLNLPRMWLVGWRMSLAEIAWVLHLWYRRANLGVSRCYRLNLRKVSRPLFEVFVDKTDW
jgi:hypothetical protein